MKRGMAGLLIPVLSVILIAYFVPLQLAQAKTITVPNDYSSIQDAIDHASAGDTVFVKQGTYYCGPDDVLLIDKPISLIGEDANSTVIDGQYEQYYPHPWGWNTLTITASNVNVKGFTFTNCENAITIHPYASSPNVSNIHITENNFIENYIGVLDGGALQDKDLFISQNTFLNNTVRGITFSGRDSTISNNIFFTNHHALYLTSADNVAVYSNNFVNNSLGLYLAGVSGISIFGNNVTGSIGYDSALDDYGYGIEFGANCNNSMVYDNNIWGNTNGINIRNILLVVGSPGVPSPQGSGNMVYNNNLFENSHNANIEHRYSHNVTGVVNGTTIVAWDNGTVGNYWSDYTGGGNHVIDENNIDHYPLNQPVDLHVMSSTDIPDYSGGDIWVQVAAAFALGVLLVIVALLGYHKRKHAQK
jgi:parallel beta-helix repeat protein